MQINRSVAAESSRYTSNTARENVTVLQTRIQNLTYATDIIIYYLRTKRERERQTDRQTDRQRRRDRQRQRDKDKQTDRQRQGERR